MGSYGSDLSARFSYCIVSVDTDGCVASGTVNGSFLLILSDIRHANSGYSFIERIHQCGIAQEVQVLVFFLFFFIYSTAKWCPTTVIRTYGTVRPWLYGETSARDTVVLVWAEKQFGLGFGLYCGFPRQQVDSLGHFDGKDRPIGLKISNRRLQTGITGCCGISSTLHRGLIIL
jgi:hypothetical protein